jgi:hypothetical protein
LRAKNIVSCLLSKALSGLLLGFSIVSETKS